MSGECRLILEANIRIWTRRSGTCCGHFMQSDSLLHLLDLLDLLIFGHTSQTSALTRDELTLNLEKINIIAVNSNFSQVLFAR